MSKYNSKLKVLHINCNYMGTKLHQTMIEHLDKIVQANTVFCPIYANSELITKPNNNVIVSSCFTSLDRFFFFKKQKKIINCMMQQLKIDEFDCIHAYTLFTDGNCAYELSKRYGIPYVVAIRATDIDFFKYRINLRRRGHEILKNASAVFFLSEATRRLFVGEMICKDIRTCVFEKSYVIPNGIDDFWLRSTDIGNEIKKKRNQHFQEKDITICCIAQILKRKNIPMLQKAITYMNKNGWNIKLIVIGKDVEHKELKIIMSHPYTEYVPPMKKEKLIEFYRKSDLFVLPSKGETFGLVYAEAMSQGLPVLYSKNEGFDGQFNEGVVGYHVDSDSYIDIAQKIELVSSNYKMLCDNCDEKVKTFDWEDIVKQYSVIYKDILKETSYEKSSIK